jgi:hypothetical protein
LACAKNKVVIMSKTPIKSLLAGSVALLGALSSAQAATYAGSWDPAYGAPFPDLYWAANATIFIPDACLAQGDGVYASGGCAGLDITSATLSFYKNVSGTQGAFLQGFTLNDNVAINSYVISNHQFAGINTNFFDPVTATAVEAGGGAYGFSLVLLNNTQAQLEYFTPPTVSVACLPGSSASLCGFSQNYANGTFTSTVPEPGTYALLAAGLGLMGVWSQRRKR